MPWVRLCDGLCRKNEPKNIKRRRRIAPALRIARSRKRSARCCALCCGIHGVERLAPGHEQTVALGAAEADVAAHLGQADPADQLAVPPPHRHAPAAHGAGGPVPGPSGVHPVTPLWPTWRPSSLEAQTFPLTSQRTPTGPHFTP